jgi:hypothetical protein
LIVIRKRRTPHGRFDSLAGGDGHRSAARNGASRCLHSCAAFRACRLRQPPGALLANALLPFMTPEQQAQIRQRMQEVMQQQSQQ